jgi:electron-transferring-flavoprotein dehydrogenase
LCGDSAGLLNAQRLKGIHLAIKSGIMAAETVFDCLKAGDFSAAQLKGYADRFEASWARTELYGTRNFHAAFEGGLYAGLFHAAVQLITGGSGLFERRPHRRDHEHMLKVNEYQRSSDRRRRNRRSGSTTSICSTK